VWKGTAATLKARPTRRKRDAGQQQPVLEEDVLVQEVDDPREVGRPVAP
jgi:hypothetical protein